MELHDLKVTLNHINTRKQIAGDGENKRLAVDLACSIRPLLVGMNELLVPVLKQVGSIPAGKPLDWLMKNNHGIDEMTFRAEFENHDVEVIRTDNFMLGLLREAKVNKFKMNWKELEFTFRVQVFVNGEQYAWLGDSLEEELTLNIVSPDGDAVLVDPNDETLETEAA